MLRAPGLRLLTAGLLLFGGAPLLANDYYVDAWNGFDWNGGTGPTDAWRTVTHALASVPDPAAGSVHTIHLAQAIYDSSSGEVFPLRMRPRVQLVGSGGPIGVILQANWAGPVLLFESFQSGTGESFDEQAFVSKLTLNQGGTGISLVTDWGSMAPRFEDVIVWQMLEAGIDVQGGAAGAAGPFAPQFERVDVWDSPIGLRASMTGEGGTSSITLVDCVLRDGFGHGIDLSNASDGGTLLLDGLRSTVRNRSGDALHVRYTNGSFITIDLRFCELVKTATDGIEIEPGMGLGGVVTTRLSHCTITEHLGVGLKLSVDGGEAASHPTELDSTIVWGNGDDLLESASAPSITHVSRCDFEDGDYLGVNGTFSADPLFVAVSFDDYRVQLDSPCVDSGNPLVGHLPGEPSMGGVVPPLDGNLDLLVGWDVGAREFAPLQVIGTPQLGSNIKLQSWGMPGGRALIYWCRQPLVAVPRVLAIGEYWLCKRAAPWRLLFTDPATPGEATLSIPNNSALVGSHFSFQAITTAPIGSSHPRVLTNPVAFTIAP